MKKANVKAKQKISAATEQTAETLSHLHNDWNGVNPVTKIIPDKRKVKQVKDKQKEIQTYKYS